MVTEKISIRFYKDREVRAVWDEELHKWWFSVLDVIGAINEQDDYAKTRNYWKYLKTKLRRQQHELVSMTNQLKLSAADGKRYNTDVLDANGIEHSQKVRIMRKIIFILLCFALQTAHGAVNGVNEKNNAEIKVEYNYHEKFMRGNVEVAERDIPMLLLANSQRSKFYSPNTEYKDSLESTPSGREISHQMLNAAVKAYVENKDKSLMNNFAYHIFMYIFKDAEKNEIVVYDKAGLIEYGTYTEDFSELIWEIGDSTKTVMGYECVMATTNYHGRHWTVWFTPEIPLQDGPWKLRGLPGLILEASEPTGQHSFTATGIERTDKEMVPVYTGGQKDYEKMPRKEMLRNLRHSKENGNAIFQAQTGMSIGTDAPVTEESKKYDYLETDYH